jgi:hypothetical protein
MSSSLFTNFLLYIQQNVQPDLLPARGSAGGVIGRLVRDLRVFFMNILQVKKCCPSSVLQRNYMQKNHPRLQRLANTPKQPNAIFLPIFL